MACAGQVLDHDSRVRARVHEFLERLGPELLCVPQATHGHPEFTGLPPQSKRIAFLQARTGEQTHARRTPADQRLQCAGLIRAFRIDEHNHLEPAREPAGALEQVVVVEGTAMLDEDRLTYAVPLHLSQ